MILTKFDFDKHWGKLSQRFIDRAIGRVSGNSSILRLLVEVAL